MPTWSAEHRTWMRRKFPASFELFEAVFDGAAHDVRQRLVAGDKVHARCVQGSTPLFHAVRSTLDLPKADLLIAAGARIDEQDNFGMEPIHWTTTHAVRDNLRCLTWLLDHGADPNAAVTSAIEPFHPVGWTPLHIATDQALLAATQLLLERGADVHVVASNGVTALHLAAAQHCVYKGLIRTLVDAGSDPNAVDAEGGTPLHILAKGSGRYRKTAIEFLLHRGARADVRDRSGRLPVDLVPDGLPASAEIRRLLSRAG